MWQAYATGKAPPDSTNQHERRHQPEHNPGMDKNRVPPGSMWRPKLVPPLSRIVAASMLVGAGAPAAPVGVAPAPTPVAVTAAFYHWYVMKFRSDHDPILELRAEAHGRVSTALLNEIDAQAEAGVSDRDYFLQENDVVRPAEASPRHRWEPGHAAPTSPSRWLAARTRRGDCGCRWSWQTDPGVSGASQGTAHTPRPQRRRARCPTADRRTGTSARGGGVMRSAPGPAR